MPRRETPVDVRLSDLTRAGVLAVIRAPSAALAVRGVEALVAGGVTGIEITYSTPGAADAIREVRSRFGDDVYLGAGTILTSDQAEQSVDAGAQFLVSPGLEPTVATAMLATGATVLIGALSPTEVMAALQIGSHAVKIFPASLGGPAYLRSLRGPFADAPLMPTGGVSAQNIGEWLAAGAIAVGAGSELCSPAALANGDWGQIEETARKFARAYADARAGAAW